MSAGRGEVVLLGQADVLDEGVAQLRPTPACRVPLPVPSLSALVFAEVAEHLPGGIAHRGQQAQALTSGRVRSVHEVAPDEGTQLHVGLGGGDHRECRSPRERPDEHRQPRQRPALTG